MYCGPIVSQMIARRQGQNRAQDHLDEPVHADPAAHLLGRHQFPLDGGADRHTDEVKALQDTGETRSQAGDGAQISSRLESQKSGMVMYRTFLRPIRSASRPRGTAEDDG